MDLAGKSVLLLGDSHTVGVYGQKLAALLTDAGADVTTIAHVGAKAADYVGHGAYAAELNAAETPDLLVITLGTNDASVYGESQGKTVDAVKSILDQVGAANAFFVGPPSFSVTMSNKYTPPLADSADAVWEAISPLFDDHSFDPRAVTAPYVSNTNIHFGTAGYTAWANSVFAALREDVGFVEGPGDSRITSGDVGDFSAAGFLLLGLAAFAVVFWPRKNGGLGGLRKRRRTKSISRARGSVCLDVRGASRCVQIDPRDVTRTSGFMWHMHQGYPATTIGHGKAAYKLYLHRLIKDAPRGHKPGGTIVVDHVNGDKLDARRSNLRTASKAQNTQNTDLISTNTTGFKGVSTKGRSFAASIHLNRRTKALGTFKTASQAACAYDRAAIKAFGDFAKINDAC